MEFTNTSLLRRFGELRTPERQSPAAAAVVDVEKGSIVLAESDPVECAHLATILRNLKYEVYTSGDGREALQLIHEHNPLLVIASLHLAGLDGYKLSKMLREAHSTEGIPIMFIVDSGEFPDQVIGHETYAHDYIQKPISVPDFNFRVNALLRLAKRSRVNSAQHQNRQNGIQPPSGLEPQPETEQAQNSTVTNLQTEPEPKGLPELLDQIQQLLAALGNCFGELQFQLKDQPLQSWKAEEDGLRSPQAGTQDHRQEGQASKGQWMSSDTEKDRNVTEEQETVEVATGSTPVAEENPPSGSSPSFGDSGGLAILEQFRQEYRDKVRSGSVFRGAVASSPIIDDILQNFFTTTAEGENPADPVQPEPHKAAAKRLGGNRPEITRDITFDPDLIERPVERSSDAVSPHTETVSAEDEQSPERLYREAEAWVNETLDRVRGGEAPDPIQGRRIIEQIKGSLEKSFSLLQLATDRTQPFSIAAHSVNVAILGVCVARVLGNRPAEFHARVGLAGLIHEVGVVRLPAGLLHKKEDLTPQELRILRNRPLHSL
ncbi:MAG: response regulator, partial [Acidobacteriota bacterium]